MNRKSIQIIFLCSALAVSIFSCKTDQEDKTPEKDPKPVAIKVSRPAFNSDSAYMFVQKQVDFGPRVPGTAEHKKAADWLEATLGKYTDAIQVQEASAKMYTGKKVPIYNIIGSFNPAASDRVLLAAHWDTRHIAEKDDDPEKQDDPILGANDGGSGVGVLLEIARQLSLDKPTKGIDIIFFDTEDLGDPDGNADETENYCLGSQYWSLNPHTPNYKAEYGILLDMVGAPDAIFSYEMNSYQYAGDLLSKIWDKGISLGYDFLFVKKAGIGVTDDHIYVMRNRKFPMVDIIDNAQNRNNSTSGFNSFHHTHDDDMDVIDKYTLGAVGETVLAVIRE